MIGRRIRQARLQAGLTLDETVALLAQAGTSLTKAGLSKYERGVSTPRASLLQVLGKALTVAPEFFLRERNVVIQWRAYRKRSRLGAKACERIQAVAQDRVESFLWLRSAVSNERSKPFPNPMPVATPEQAEHAAMELRRTWDLGASPIESLVEMFEGRDGIVVELPDGGDAFDGLAGVAEESYPVLVMQQDVASDRKRFTMAHELGHLVMDTSGVASSREEERLAHRFAAAFLVPREVAIRELGQKRARLSFEELRLLKQKHGLSMQAWLYRARDLGIIEEGHFNTLYVNLCAYGWRRQEPGEYKGREEQTRFRQMVYRALAEGLIQIEEAAGWCPELKERSMFSTARNEARQDVGPRAVYSLPLGRREAVLRDAATSLADVYGPGSPVLVGDVFDDPGNGGRRDAR